MKTRMIAAGLFLLLAQLPIACGKPTGISGNVQVETPDEIAVDAKEDQLDAAARADLYAGKYALAESEVRQVEALGDEYAEDDDDLLAIALLDQGKTEAADAIYSRLADEGAGTPETMLPYALSLLKQGNWSQALQLYRLLLPDVDTTVCDGVELLKADSVYSADTPAPNDLEADIHIAMGYSGIDDLGRTGPRNYEISLAEYKEALQAEPDLPLANLAYADGLLNVGKQAEADDLLNQIVQNDTGDVVLAAKEELGGFEPALHSGQGIEEPPSNSPIIGAH